MECLFMAMMSGGESRRKDDQEQKYHLDISNIQRYPKLQTSAIYLNLCQYCDMPYISVTALRFQMLNRKILLPQHIGVNPFSAYPVAGKDYVHKPSVSHRPTPRKAGKSIVALDVEDEQTVI